MSAYVLIVLTWMTLLSEPGGAGQFWQVTKGFPDQESCEKQAIKEAEQVKEANTSPLVQLQQTHSCLTAFEFEILSLGGRP